VSARILWSVLGARGELQLDRLRNVSSTGGLIATESLVRVGEELRFDLLDDAGERFASGLARVTWTDPARGMGISFLSVGVDKDLIQSLTLVEADPFGAPPSSKRKPPPVPGGVNAPPLPIAPSMAAMAAVRPPAERADEEEELAPQIEPLAVKRPRMIIGIDLGTTTTCASHVVDGKPQIIPGRTGTNTIPSMITFDEGGAHHVGQRAADRHVLEPLRTVYGSKRLVGRTYRAEVAAELQQRFAYPLAEADGQRFGARIDDRVISMDTVARLVLEEVRGTAEEHLKQPVEAAVITVPAYFSEVQREAVRRAAADAKLVVHRIVNEPTAAAVAYGHKQGQKKARVAVWDFGGGTFDFSIVDVTDGQIEVLVTAGDNFIGGGDFDDLLASYLLAEFNRQAEVEIEPQPQQIARLREAAEIAKRALSAQTEYLVELPEFTRQPLRNLSVEVTREEFEELIRPLIERTLAIATEVMATRDLTPKDVEDVLLVGGSTRVPAVQRAVEGLFGRRPSKRINPDEAVALGAALLADEIGGEDGPTLLDVLPMTVGRGRADCRFEPIVARNTRLPAQCEITVSADLLGTVSVPLFQGESPNVSENEYLCSAVVEDPSLRDDGRVLLRLSFDEHCVMAVDARNARTKRALPVKIDRSRPLDEILRELGRYEGPAPPVKWQPPESTLGKVFGKLFKLFKR
jgi:molecular chaperone DnaK